MQIRHIGEQHKHSQTHKARTAPARYRQNIELSNSALIALFDRSPDYEYGVRGIQHRANTTPNSALFRGFFTWICRAALDGGSAIGEFASKYSALSWNLSGVERFRAIAMPG